MIALKRLFFRRPLVNSVENLWHHWHGRDTSGQNHARVISGGSSKVGLCVGSEVGSDDAQENY